MLLLRDERTTSRLAYHITRHRDIVRAVAQGTVDLPAVHAVKFAETCRQVLAADMYRDLLDGPARRALAEFADRPDPARVDEVLSAAGFLGKKAVSARGRDAFTRPMNEFLHYYESSGTTGDPVPAPKALDDLTVNTINIGEMWARLLRPQDVALIMIAAPFAPAGYQFEKVLEYLEVMSFRPAIDNVTGGYGRLLRLIREVGANVFVGPASRLLALVQANHREGGEPLRFDRLLVMAEQTGPHFLAHIERLTGATAYVGSYGSSETSTIGVTCEHRSMHIQSQSFLLELENERGVFRPTAGRHRGELVVTTLDIPSRPLLRYRTGDLVEIDYESGCACGLALPVLRTLGRTQDVLLYDDRGIDQDAVEQALWTHEGTDPDVFNYMLVVRGDEVLCLITANTGGESDADRAWHGRLEQRLAPLFSKHTVRIRQVDVLPPLAGLGSYLGWKLARVLDLDDAANWDRLPGPIRDVVHTSLAQISSLD
jgi:phenylacetate-CoA ligase